MPKERVLITVKTYPALSNKYDEVVCTAGLREDGTWVRLYPIPFRKLEEIEQYKKFDVVEVDLVRNTTDPRPESYRIQYGIKVVEHLDHRNWHVRRRKVLENAPVYTDFDQLITDNKSDRGVSLATFKPSTIIKMEIDEDEREWNAEKLEKVKLKARQSKLFEDNDKVFSVVSKLPYKFKYVFTDVTGRERTLTVNDWEIGALFWNEKKRFHGDETKALESVQYMYMTKLIEDRDVHFFVGTTQSWDSMNAPNPFMIIGVFSPPHEFQQSLF